MLWDFEIVMDHPILARWLVLINRKQSTCHLVNFVFPAEPRVKMKESKKIEKILGPW